MKLKIGVKICPFMHEILNNHARTLIFMHEIINNNARTLIFMHEIIKYSCKNANIHARNK